MDYEWIGKTIKKSDPKNLKKTVKIKVKLPHVNIKNHRRESEFLFKHRLLTLL